MTSRILFEARNVPAYQNKMFETREAAHACPTGDVVIAQDPASGLVRNIAYEPGILCYDETYQNEQGNSPQFRDHLDQVLAKVTSAFGSRDILEIGCGKGLFVELMRDRGLRARGIDDAYEGHAPYIEKRHFGAAVETCVDAIVLRHVLEHIPDPQGFLHLIAAANGHRGLIYIEVPCFDWIMRNRAWFDVFYEHVNYFRLDDFHRLFGQVNDSGHLFGGQYLYAIADLSSLRTELPASARIDFPADFTRALDSLAEQALAAPLRRRVIWGAAAKGVMFSHFLGHRGVAFDAAVDINPGKQGRYLASSGLRVASPEQVLDGLPPGSDIYVMNSNYLPEVSEAGGNLFRYIPVDKT
ncbi:class I SAM-dependent methyltransferase [Thermomonas sp.]|uniref:class I SAM-dependent methyltransferase n=1 Tax=Thermomonas sp. TaxID=1971895 RepID=UPI0025FB70F7|nr:class I SAM-dependent methyltransferase [Thermomonas sp.]